MKAGLPFKYIIIVKKEIQYVVFDYKDVEGTRKRKRLWVYRVPEILAGHGQDDYRRDNL